MRLKLDQIRRDRLDELFRILSNNLRIQGTGRGINIVRFIFCLKNKKDRIFKMKLVFIKKEILNGIEKLNPHYELLRYVTCFVYWENAK